MKLAGSILSMKEPQKENIARLDSSTIDYIHLDIMDGKFVESKTWNVTQLQSLLTDVQKNRDIHLMVEDVESYIEEFQIFHPKFITFHLEATESPLKIIEKIHHLNIGVGLSIKPNTPLEAIQPYLAYLDLVLVMSVEPGKGGQTFLENSEERINQLALWREEECYHYLIEVDGGINDKTIEKCKKADIAVVGSYITNHDNYQGQIDSLKKKCEK